MMKRGPERQNTAGQATIEGILALGLVLIPSVAAIGYVFRSDWEKTRCAYQSYRQARSTLIATGSTVRFQQSCGSVREELTLLPLESLDLDRGGLDLGDLREEVSRSWALFLSWRSRQSLSRSSESAGASGAL